MNKSRLDSLIEESAIMPHALRLCFAQKLEGDAKAYLDAVSEQFFLGKAIVASNVSRILEREFEVRITSHSVRRHFKGDCPCPKPKQKD